MPSEHCPDCGLPRQRDGIYDGRCAAHRGINEYQADCRERVITRLRAELAAEREAHSAEVRQLETEHEAALGRVSVLESAIGQVEDVYCAWGTGPVEVAVAFDKHLRALMREGSALPAAPSGHPAPALGQSEQRLLDGFRRWKRGDLNTEEFEGLFHELEYQHCAAHAEPPEPTPSPSEDKRVSESCEMHGIGMCTQTCRERRQREANDSPKPAAGRPTEAPHMVTLERWQRLAETAEKALAENQELRARVAELVESK